MNCKNCMFAKKHNLAEATFYICTNKDSSMSNKPVYITEMYGQGLMNDDAQDLSPKFCNLYKG